MTTFSEFQTTSASPVPDRLIKRPEPILFLICLLLGLGIIAWRAKSEANSERAKARSEALAWCAAIEQDLNAALAAAQAPATMARNGGKVLPDFSRARTQLDKIQDYNYVLYMPSGTKERVVFAKRGSVTFENAEEQSVKPRNYDFRLALEPSGGWYNKIEIGFEVVVLLLVSTLSCLLVNTLRSRGELEASLANESRRLTRETASRKQVENELHASKQAAANVQAELKQIQARLQQAEAAETELKIVQPMLQQSEAVAADLSAQLQSIFQAQKEAELAAQTKIQQVQGTLRERETKINSLLSALDAAERKFAALEGNHEDLKVRFVQYQEAEERAAQLTIKLKEVEAELLHHKSLISASIQLAEELSPAEPRATEEGGASVLASRSVGAEEGGASVLASRSVDTCHGSSGASAHQPNAIPNDEIEDPTSDALAPGPLAGRELERGASQEVESAVITESSTLDEEDTLPWDADEPVDEPLISEPEFLPPEETTEADIDDSPAPLLALEETQNTPAMPPTAPEAVQTAPEVLPQEKPAEKPKAKRKKTRRDDQISLFEAATPEIKPSPAPIEPKKEVPSELSFAFDTPEPSSEAPSETQKKNTVFSPAQFRKAVNELMPLLAGEDPGAMECFQEHQETFRSASSEEAFLQFEQFIGQNNYAAALELLKKAAKRHI